MVKCSPGHALVAGGDFPEAAKRTVDKAFMRSRIDCLYPDNGVQARSGLAPT
jgi:hypothetical protein